MTTLKQIIDEARRLEKEATPGPWETEIALAGKNARPVGPLSLENQAKRDAVLLSHLRNFLPTLIAQVEIMKSALAGECWCIELDCEICTPCAVLRTCGFIDEKKGDHE